MKIIDAHLHYLVDPYFDQLALRAGHENREAHLREAYQELGIAHGIVMGNRSLTSENHQYPDFLHYCVGLDSTYFREEGLHQAAAMVETHLQRAGCVGIKLYPGYNPHYVYDPIYDPFYELARSYHKPVAIHTGATASPNARLRYSHPLTLDEVAARWPDVQFVMCHLGNPWIVDAVAVLDKNQNVAADLSGILEGLLSLPEFFKESSGYIQHLKTWLGYLGGYDRLMFGTDWPLANLDNYIEFVAEVVPPRYHQQVFFDNANRIYQLGLL